MTPPKAAFADRLSDNLHLLAIAALLIVAATVVMRAGETPHSRVAPSTVALQQPLMPPAILATEEIFAIVLAEVPAR
jgi:hypothetical protein